MKVVITTGGGDAPGLNAVIRGAVLAGCKRGWEMFGSRRGFSGILGDARVLPLDETSVRGITHLGGTILGTTNRGNPFRWPFLGLDQQWREEDRSAELVDRFRSSGFDALITVGGDGTLTIAQQLHELGLPVVGVPKTIDNDVAATDVTFGFDTAVATATDALDKVHSTAEAHERVLVVEVMGRNAGWIALHAGLGGGADVILIPEVDYEEERVCDKVREREADGIPFSVIVVAEGAKPVGGAAVVRYDAEVGGEERLGGVAETVAAFVAARTGKETRTLTLGHLLRGGSPTTFDRLLALRFGAAAVRAIDEGAFGTMVAYDPPEIRAVSLAQAVGKLKTVPLDGDTMRTARDVGISFGD